MARCLRSLEGLPVHVVIVDCFSNDKTISIARSFNAQILQREWTSHATQFNWALDQLDVPDSDWIFRLDADEIVTPELRRELSEKLPFLDDDICGVFVPRCITFQKKILRYGGVSAIPVLRLFRYGTGRCEVRWMDEHIQVRGRTAEFSGEVIDDNLNSLTWWTEKHNRYASREAADLLNFEYKLATYDSFAECGGRSRPEVKRWVKENLYCRLPLGFRAFIYFVYRFIIQLGFLDGYPGVTFHVLQGFWYRFLVDAKVAEVKCYMRDHKVTARTAIEDVLGIKI